MSYTSEALLSYKGILYDDRNIGRLLGFMLVGLHYLSRAQILGFWTFIFMSHKPPGHVLWANVSGRHAKGERHQQIMVKAGFRIPACYATGNEGFPGSTSPSSRAL